MNKKSNSNILKILQTVFSALIGVQSKKNMQKDFDVGKPYYYIIAGIITVLIILIVLYNLVKYIAS